MSEPEITVRKMSYPQIFSQEVIDDWAAMPSLRKISDALSIAGQPLTKQGIEDRVTGKAQFVRQALAALTDEGYVSVASGPRGSHLHTLARPFGGDGA